MAIQELASNDQSSPVVTRFAPSPTGRLHIGSVRTALYNWLYARHLGGQFLLRIEDTDSQRSSDEYRQQIVDGLAWLELNWDGSYVSQSDRRSRHQAVAEQLLSQGRAYRCVCSVERLTALREQQIKQGIKPAYDGRCRRAEIGANSEQAFVVRLAVPKQDEISIDDTLRGTVRVDNRQLDDMVLLRADGTPTYQLSVVVDDIDMGVTHIIRGDDHLNNAVRQAHLYQALGHPVPRYTHLPLILDQSGKRLSKRSLGAGLSDDRRRGVSPDALLNYVLRLGWSHGDQEYFTRQQMIELFDLTGLNRSACAVNLEKLAWLNRRHIQSSDPTRLRRLTADYANYCLAGARSASVDRASLEPDASDQRSDAEPPVLPDELQGQSIEQWLGDVDDKIFEVARDKANDLNELLHLIAPLVRQRSVNSQLVSEHNSEQTRQHIQAAGDALVDLKSWDVNALSDLLKMLCRQRAIKMPQLAVPLRIALLGTNSRLGISQILWALGKKHATERIDLWLTHSPAPTEAKSTD